MPKEFRPRLSSDTENTVSIEEKANRQRLSVAYEITFINNPSGKSVLADIAGICHFMDPAKTPEDMALQNAFKTILHRMGRWIDDEKGAEELIDRLLGR